MNKTMTTQNLRTQARAATDDELRAAFKQATLARHETDDADTRRVATKMAGICQNALKARGVDTVELRASDDDITFALTNSRWTPEGERRDVAADVDVDAPADTCHEGTCESPATETVACDVKDTVGYCAGHYAVVTGDAGAHEPTRSSRKFKRGNCLACHDREQTGQFGLCDTCRRQKRERVRASLRA